MVSKVVSTKLSDEEHQRFLDFCNKKGVSSSAAIKESIEELITEKEVIIDKESIKEMSIEELEKALRKS